MDKDEDKDENECMEEVARTGNHLENANAKKEKSLVERDSGETGKGNFT